jgi:hypothetical protein
MYVSEPTSTGAAASAAGMAAWKAAGGAAGVAAGGAGLAAIVVMLMTPPRSPREWAVGLISTVLGSVCGGAMVIEWLELQRWMYSTSGLVSLLGLVFACGLPAWAIVRWLFTYLERRKDRDVLQVFEELRGADRERR